jgi:hypothetical protein
MPETRPLPIFGLLDQSPLDRVAVHVAKLLDALLFREDIEIVVPSLPERTFPAS